MILDPGIIALLVSSTLVCLLTVLSSWHGYLVLRRWDLASGSSLQLDLERRTYLVSTVLAYVLVFQLASLFLFVYLGDSLAGMFTGAMCAAGTLNVNRYGYPTLVLKVLNFLLAGLWLIVNYTDNRAENYPLIRKKYALLLVMTPLIAVEAFLQAAYFLELDPQVITSCCGSLFSSSSSGAAGSLASLPVVPVEAAFALLTTLAAVAGVAVFRSGRGAYAVAGFSCAAFVVGVAALITFIGPYIYELPTHRCPFCILQREYGYIGYAFYALLLGGAITGVGAGAIQPFRSIESLQNVVPGLQRRLSLLAAVLFFSLAILTVWVVLRSNLRW